MTQFNPEIQYSSVDQMSGGSHSSLQWQLDFLEVVETDGAFKIRQRG